MPNKTLKATVRLETRSAEQSLTRLAKKINNVQKAINQTSNNNNKLNTAIKKAVTSTNKLDSATKKVANTTNKVANTAKKVNNANVQAANSANRLSNAYRSGNTNANRLLKTMRSLASTYLGIMGTKAVLTASDTVTSAKNRLNNIKGGNPQLTQESMDKIYTASQRSRSGYTKMLDNVGKTMTLAGESFQNNVDNAIRFQEIMSKAYTVGGASAAEQASSMYQLVQALGSGILQGDELRSVREGAPIAYKEIEKFAQGVFKTEESLKELASQGVITSDIIVAAIMNAEEEITKSFENTKMTFAQAFNMVGNMAIQAFRPVLQMLNDALNSTAGQAIINGLGNAFVVLANIILWVGDILGAFFNWFVENWYWIQWIVFAVITALVIAFTIWAAKAIWAGITAFFSFLMGLSPLYLWIIMIGIVVAYIVWLANTTASGAEFMIYALMGVALAILLIGIITGSTALMIAGVVIAVVALIVALFAYCGEQIMGGAYAVGAFLYNLLVGFLNQALQMCMAIIDPILGIIEFILNACNGGFNSFGGAVANLIGQIISWFLSLGKVVTTIIDAIFGTDWTSGLSSLQDKVLSWGKNEDAVTLDRNITVSEIAGKFGAELPDRIAYGDAYSKGANVGKNLENKINSMGSSLKDKISGFGVGDLGKLLGIDFGKFTNTGKPGNGSYLPDPYDPRYGLGNAYDPSGVNDDILKGLEELNGTTGDIKDSMDLSNDDLEYLRKIADMEWRNEFTTAEIKVDMTNHNTVNGERDLDGIVEYLSDVLRSEMTNVAYGTHY